MRRLLCFPFERQTENYRLKTAKESKTAKDPYVQARFINVLGKKKE